MRKGEVVVCNEVSYSLIESIGSGGSGVVWKAKTNNENYAVKFLNSDVKDKNTEALDKAGRKITIIL